MGLFSSKEENQQCLLDDVKKYFVILSKVQQNSEYAYGVERIVYAS